MAHDVFISYSSKDKAIADAACATLESNGVRCWIAPRDIIPGVEYAEALVEAIQSSRLFILVFSSGANDSIQVRQEVERAVSRGIPILPFRIENVPPNRAMEFFISGRHWLDAITPPIEAHLQELAKTSKLLLSRPIPPPQPIPVPPHPDPVPPRPVPLFDANPHPGPVPNPNPVPHPSPLPYPTPQPVPVTQQPIPGWLQMTKQQALNHMRLAWIAGVFSSAMTVLLFLASLSGSSVVPGLKLDWTALIDVAIMLGLSWGVFKKVRWCAFGLLGYFVLNKLIMWSSGIGANAFGIVLSFVFLYFFFQGIRGTWAYQLMKESWDRPAIPTPAPSHF